MKVLQDDIEAHRTLYELAKQENIHLAEQLEVNRTNDSPENIRPTTCVSL